MFPINNVELHFRYLSVEDEFSDLTIYMKLQMDHILKTERQQHWLSLEDVECGKIYENENKALGQDL